MTIKRLRTRLAVFMAVEFREEVKGFLPDWNGTAEQLLPYIDPIRDVPYVILAIRKENLKGWEDILSLA